MIASLCFAPHAEGCAKLLRTTNTSAALASPEDVTTRLASDHHWILRKARDQTLDAKQRHELLRAYAKPKPKAFWMRTTVVINWVFSGWLGYQSVSGISQDPTSLATTILLIPPTLWLADLGGQIFHKWLDSYASERNPIWGDTAREFRLHHEVPDNLNEEDYLSNIAPASIMVAPFLASAAALNLGPEAATAINVFLMSVLHTNEFHKQAHLKNPNPMFKFLQKIRLSLDPRTHRDHHKPPFDKEFSVFLGWANAATRKFDLWNRLDHLFWRVTGRMPHNWVQDPRSIPEAVVEEIVQDAAKITDDDLQDLTSYGQTYRSRANPQLRNIILAAQARWQNDFIAKRRTHFQEMAIVEPELAEADWMAEQKEFPWLYAEKVQPLFY